MGNFIYAMSLVGAALAYYLLAAVLIGRLLSRPIPAAWLVHWQSPSSGMLAWFLLMNALGCLAAAIPIAIAIVWASPRLKQLFAFAVSTLTATLVVGRLFDSDLSPGDHGSADYWINGGVLFLAFVLAVPLAVAVVSGAWSLLRARRPR